MERHHDEKLEELLRDVDDKCERERLRGMWQRLEELEVEDPSPGLGRRFADSLRTLRMLEAERSAPRRWPIAVAAACLVVGLGAGVLLAPALIERPSSPEIATLRIEVSELRWAVSASLSHRSTAAARLAAVEALATAADKDEAARVALVDRVLLDPSVNVRLAAIDALRPHAGEPALEDSLIRALERADAPIVAIALIDLLVEGSVRSAAPVLRRLARDPSLDAPLREKLDWALERLDERRTT